MKLWKVYFFICLIAVLVTISGVSIIAFFNEFDLNDIIRLSLFSIPLILLSVYLIYSKK
jgi:hypothetical protein